MRFGFQREGRSHPPRVMFITNAIVPYRVPVYAALAAHYSVTVAYSVRSEKRALPFEANAMDFPYKVVGGLSLNIGGKTYHLSPRLIAMMARERPDILVSSGYSFPTLYASVYALLWRRKLIVSNDGTSVSEAQINLLQRIARRLCLRVASACIAPGKLAQQRFIELGVDPSRVFRVPLTTDLKSLHQVAEARIYDRPAPLTVLALGRLVPCKRLESLIRAMQIVKASGRCRVPLRLVIAGEGEEDHRLRTLAADLGPDRVEFTGFVQREKLPSLLAKSDVFVFPSERDAYGVAMLEAASSGLPIVASRHAGATADILRGEDAGVVIDPDDPPGIAEGLIRLASSADVRRRLGRAAAANCRPLTAEAAVDGLRAAMAEATKAVP